MNNFLSFGLPNELLNSLQSMNFTEPTPVQAEAIPAALEGKDVLGSAQTGTGKTGAFGIPLVAELLNNPESVALVLTPTRELAQQVLENLKKFVGKNQIATALIIGGDSMVKQFKMLQGKPRIIVGTPGRLNDHLERGSLKLNKASFFVLDEIDRMLDMGFGIQIERIVSHLPEQRQTLMFTATLPKAIEKLSHKYLKNPVRVSIGSSTAIASGVTQETIKTTEDQKFSVLTDKLNEREGSVIIFVKTKWSADKLSDKLNDHDHSSSAIHGDLRQNKRERVIKAFRNKRTRVLVATDIAARGLDIPHIENVINYDLPQCPEDYIHRIGRTGRAGKEGVAINLLSTQDNSKWYAIQKMLNPDAKVELEKSPKSGKKSGKGGRSGRGSSERGGRGFERSDRGGRSKFSSGSRDRRSERPAFDGERSENENKRPKLFSKGGEGKFKKSDDSKRSFEKSEDGFKKSFNRDDRPSRSFNRSEDRPNRSFNRKDEDGSRGNFRKSERSERSYGKSQDGFAKKSFNRDDRPSKFARRDEEGSARKTFRREEDSKKSFGKRSEGGFKKDFRKDREEGSERRFGGKKSPKSFGSGRDFKREDSPFKKKFARKGE